MTHMQKNLNCKHFQSMVLIVHTVNTFLCVSPADEGDLFAEIPPLLPNTTYRIMIESINQLNDKVDGTFFSCKT
jgi:hypothetical protein